MGGVFSQCVSNVSETRAPDIDPLQFLQKNQATAISGWKEIYEFLAPRKYEINKSCEDITIIKYKTLTIKFYGKITVDDTLHILSEWEYYHIIEYANAIPVQVVKPVTIQHQNSGTNYEFGLVQTGPWTPLGPNPQPEDAIIWVSGSADVKDVELFNGQTNMYLKVIQMGGGYNVEVAERPLQADSLSRFDLSDPSGTIQLVVDPNYYLKFYSDDPHVDATDAKAIPVSSAPKFHFDIQFLAPN